MPQLLWKKEEDYKNDTEDSIRQRQRSMEKSQTMDDERTKDKGRHQRKYLEHRKRKTRKKPS
jgi:hypothetical protein